MKKLNHNKVLNIVAALLFAVSLMCGNALQVRAYTDLNGYPIIIDNMGCTRISYNSDGSVRASDGQNGTLVEQNSYFFDFSNSLDKVSVLQFGNYDSSLVLPINLDIYDYYLTGTIAFNSNIMLDFSDIFFYQYHNSQLVVSEVYENFINFDNLSGVSGKSFYGKIDFNNEANLSYLQFNFISDMNLDTDIWFSGSIVPVAKGTEAEQLNQAILNELVKINQNLITANTLQQQTIDAIKDHDTNVGNWFTTLTSNLGSWFQQLYTSMGVGFEKLYQQMTKEQDEQLHGYQDTTTSEAANAFSSESDKLTALEGDLSNQSNQYVSDFTAEGFDLGILATIGSSMVFVTTWFTNFWNMGGIWTAGLNFCFALTIVFFIFRFKR